MVTLHDNYFCSNKSATTGELDCRIQMSIRTLLRTLSHNYIKKEWRNGPFLLQLTDLHQSNIFVDNDWNITCLLDLEWLCALPPEALYVPYWLTNQGIADLVDEGDCRSLTEYNCVWQEFMQAFSEEESKVKLAWPLKRIIQDMWQSKGTWFWLSLKSVDAAYYLVSDHLCPRFSADLSLHVVESFSQFWKEGANELVVKKVSDYHDYEEELGRLFE
ncbi:hypothetical protein ED733_002968 [Metarhizium rileyi]|uniref:Aminoglycoside phosphotransferase domain-containing protein n=1 Tax=Metarhizium rileyi (strain RCEF 4871) TaxID=1649241 RepID=A0A5C6FZV6_METRR|nr:hypothetical protein ED733_002968 [Metarhizium rileyi]